MKSGKKTKKELLLDKLEKRSVLLTNMEDLQIELLSKAAEVRSIDYEVSMIVSKIE